MQIPRSSFASLFPIFLVLAFPAKTLGPVNGSPQAMAQASEETPKDMFAAQIRRQGFACDKPQSATRDEKLSRPDEAVWILTCENATYQVRLIPDMAAQAQQLDQRK
jgi:hypothetical protein